MIIFTLWVTGLGLLSSSSSITLEKWLSCQIGWPSLLSRDNCGAQHVRSTCCQITRTLTHTMKNFPLTSSTSETHAGKKVMKTKQLAKTDMQPKQHIISSCRTPEMNRTDIQKKNSGHLSTIKSDNLCSLSAFFYCLLVNLQQNRPISAMKPG